MKKVWIEVELSSVLILSKEKHIPIIEEVSLYQKN